MNDGETRAGRLPRGIYLLPNLLTTAALFAGFYAIVSAMQGRFVEAAVAVFVAGVLDGLDGRIARLTGTQSAFGVQYDSLSDMVSFGMAPALVMYAWSLSALRELGPTFGKIGWSVAFLYAACAALRLARFNTQAGVADKRYFQGLASPAAAAFLMAFVWTVEELGRDGAELAWLAASLTALASLLMVSRVRYWSFKALPAGERVPFVWILLLVGIFVLIAVDPPRILLAIATFYLLSGPAMTLWGRRRMRGQRSGETAP
ncbi:MAG: CDP-diacylglycerol--serine O-phosphatidyltransferase [Xanthomonadales bacterium]|nr:CDP-diacylglycerol--serine O-phosphatidyltransferase [Xanthomonadales bacterium]